MIKIEIKNLPQFQTNMKKLHERILENIEGALEANAKNIAEKARERVSVKTGALKESISIQKGEGDLNYLVQADAPYARFVEFGYFKTPARPFMVPAFEESKGENWERIIRAINQAIKG